MQKLLIVAIILFGLVACNTEELNRLRIENESLKGDNLNKDDVMLGFIETMNSIQNNLDSISFKEGIISNIASQGENSKSVDQQINDQVNNIYDLLIQNRKKLEQLNQQSKKLSQQNKDFKEIIDRLTSQLEHKAIEIEKLCEILENKNFQISGLTAKADSLHTITVHQHHRIEEADLQIEQQQEQLNTAFYVIGTEKELVKNEVLSKKGRIMPDLNKDYFEKINIYEKKSFIIGYKKIQVVSSHPNDSYSLYGKNIIDSLIVDNPDSFWSNSKYLIISVK